MSTKMKMTPRQKAMWPILILGAFFEGFDDALINIALPYIKADFDLSTQMSGYALTIIAFGTMVAFFVSRMADKVGRRKVFLTCVYMYSICSLVTAFAPNIEVFIFCQFVARIFLIGCWSLGYVIVCEEFDAEYRGNAVGKFQLTAVFGALLIGLLLPVFTKIGLSWRALYVVGAIPILPVFLMRKRLPETYAFLELQEAKEKGLHQEKEDFFAPWRQPHTKFLVIMCLVWVFLYFGVKGTLNFFSLRVVEELDWSANLVSLALVAQTLTGMILIALNGKLLDAAGRKKAATIIIVLGCIFSALTFTMKNFYLVLLCSIFASGFANSYLIVASTITNELFPTQIRANAMAWSNNIVGRLGQIIVPTAVTTLAIWLGLGNAVAVAVSLPIVSLILILVFLPETGLKNGKKADAQSTETVSEKSF